MKTLSAKSIIVHRSRRQVLGTIDLTFEPGRVTAVLGPNGAGKSTLLSCLAGLLKPSQGHIELGGQPLPGFSPRQRAREIAFLPQMPEIAWPIDVAALVGLARIPFRGVSSTSEDQRAVQQAMERTDVAAWAGRDVTTLSGGERARVLLARLLAGEPDWVLADEPFAGLDPSHQFEAADLLRSIASKGNGVVLTIHDLSLAARIADRVVILAAGQVVADGTPAEALSPDTLRKVYGIEVEWLAGQGEGSRPLIAIRGRHVH